jgi:hypothetical protein
MLYVFTAREQLLGVAAAERAPPPLRKHAQATHWMDEFISYQKRTVPPAHHTP